ncbi:MAG: PorV/PorQ family protein [Candidatus Eisenbacteria sp.]|nr:PorV/PorQ family protein [Candidatus Eisenbacteria bacterium]
MTKFSTAMTASLLALAVGLAAAGPCPAEDLAHSAPFLGMGVGPRALAMGGAYVGVADDVTAGYWNPAGLMQIDWIEATFMYSDMDLDRKYNYFAYGHHLDFGAVAISWINSGTDDIKIYNPDGTADGTDNWNDNALLLSYGTGLGGFYVGGTAKILCSKMGDQDDTGFGVDAAVRFVPSSKLAVGIILQDIGTQYWGETVPSTVRVGVALKSADEDFLIAADIDKKGDEDIRFHLGAEFQFAYVPGNYAALRAGLVSSESQEDNVALSFGAGLWVGSVSLDYAYLPEKQEFMNSSHRIALTGRF